MHNSINVDSKEKKVLEIVKALIYIRFSEQTKIEFSKKQISLQELKLLNMHVVRISREQLLINKQES